MTIVMAQQGWQCPNCGNIISPNMMWCPFCSGEKKVTYTATTSTPYKIDTQSVCKEETEMERLERIDNELEDAWARIRELTDEPQDEQQTIRCPKCGRTDYIRDLEKDMGVKDPCFKYKCINCNTYIGDARLKQAEKPNNSKEMDYLRFMDERKMDEELAKRFKERSNE